MDDLGRRLRRFRENRKLSIYDVERRTGLHFSTISKYERNERQPSLEALRELAAVYQVPVTALIADQVDLQSVLPPRIAALAAVLLDRPELVEACELLIALDRQQLAALVTFLERLGVGRPGEPPNAKAPAAPAATRPSPPSHPSSSGATTNRQGDRPEGPSQRRHGPSGGSGRGSRPTTSGPQP